MWSGLTPFLYCASCILGSITPQS